MFSLIYQDDDLLVLHKPAGLLAVPGRGPELRDCLSGRVQAEFPSALVVHRLDRDTSGVMVMALCPAAQRELNRQFAERLVEKRYQAIVFGSPSGSAGTIGLAMRKDFQHPPRHKIDPLLGRPARTDWRLLERSEEQSRLEAHPRTGRSHQIRLHLAAIGHPILGDNLYAHPSALAMAPRLMLHAEELCLAHPSKGILMRWQVPSPF